MRIVLAAVGRQRAGPEREIVERYLERAGRAGRSLGFSGPDLIEVEEGRERDAARRQRAEGQKLLAAVSPESRRIVLDARGRGLTTEELTELMARWRDEGAGTTAFLVGGADGHGEEVRREADLMLSLGAMTWPHLLVRAMLAEQIYRCMTVLAGHPYHRG